MKKQFENHRIIITKPKKSVGGQKSMNQQPAVSKCGNYLKTQTYVGGQKSMNHHFENQAPIERLTKYLSMFK